MEDYSKITELTSKVFQSFLLRQMLSVNFTLILQIVLSCKHLQFCIMKLKQKPAGKPLVILVSILKWISRKINMMTSSLWRENWLIRRTTHEMGCIFKGSACVHNYLFGKWSMWDHIYRGKNSSLVVIKHLVGQSGEWINSIFTLTFAWL